MRTKQFNIRFSADEAALATALANHYGINVANLVRMLMTREFRRIDQEQKLKERRTR